MKNKAIEFRIRANEALEQIGKEMGMDISVGNISYTNNSFNAKVIANVSTIGGMSFEQMEFEKICQQYSMEKKHYNAIVNLDGTDYKIIGFNVGAKKYKVEVKRVKDNAGFRFVTSKVLAELKKYNSK